MLIFIFLLNLTAVLADKCPFIYDDQSYTKTTVLNTTGLPTNLVFNPNTKDLLFTLIDLETLQNDSVQTKMDQYILRNGEAIKINNVNGQAAAVDVENNVVYIATDDGIYTLNNTNEAEYMTMKNRDIVQLYKPPHGDDLYVVRFPANTVYVVNVKTKDRYLVDDIPCAIILAVDSNNNVFYECDSKYVKVLLKDFHEPIEFFGLAKNTAKAFTIDQHDRAILAAHDGLYHLRTDNVIPRKLMNLNYAPSGIAFDKSNIFIASHNVIYKYTNAECDET